MYTAEFQHDVIATTGVADNGLAYEIDRCVLFSFQQKELNIHLGVSEIISGSYEDNPQRGRASGGILTRREVEFIFLTARFRNDFEAISKVLSLISAAEHNQFGLKHQELSMGCLVPPSRSMTADNSGHAAGCFTQSEPVQADIFVRKAQFRNTGSGGYGLGLTLGLKTPERTSSIDLPIFWVHHLKNGLKKALNWIKPTAGIRAG